MKLQAYSGARVGARFVSPRAPTSSLEPASSLPTVICHMSHMTDDQFCLAVPKSLGIPGADPTTRPPQEERGESQPREGHKRNQARRPRKEIGRKEVS